MKKQPSLSSSCLQSTRSPRRCSTCDRLLAGETAHLPLYQCGIFCTMHCPVCRPNQAAGETQPLELFDEGAEK
jgi:hypothetical protein